MCHCRTPELITALTAAKGDRADPPEPTPAPEDVAAQVGHAAG